MAHPLIKKIIFDAHTLRYHLGNWGVLGLLAIISAGLFYFMIVLPLQDNILDASKRLDQERQRSAINKQALPIEDQLTEGQHFKKLPHFSTKETALKTLVSLADRQYIQLKEGQYSVAIKEAGEVAIVQMSFPIQTSYPQLTHFLASIINASPYTALSQLSIRRHTADSNLIEANVNLTLYFSKERP